MNLLDKFNSVEITSDTRISETDRNICILHKEAYDKARSALKDLISISKRYVSEQDDVLSAIGRSCSSYLKVDIADLDRELSKSHNTFIHNIASYFRSRYNANISDRDIEDVLLPKRPETSRHSYCKEEWMAYEDTIRNLSLEYADVLDQVFIQLGGLTFKEKELAELKEACHKMAWNCYNGHKDYEQKKATITFGRYGCGYDGSYGYERWNLRDDMKSVIRGLNYFELGMTGALSHAFDQLLSYHFEQNEFDTPYMEKIKGVKCFKNGRVDIRFASEALARQFADEFLGNSV